ncbi:LamG domain-containing protein [Micromonospora zingiberis]|uniref:LamG domain-containing protein n=1 Tax=Micromonospora zingiberis TaxID=2053011 RepID=UPI0013F47F20|nr:LamG domain-containing protein [Micromonospora zingiberis]
MLEGSASDTPTYLSDWSGNGHDLTITGPYGWTRDRAFSRDGALKLELANDSCGQTAGPVLRTDASFTVAAWVMLESTTGQHVVVSQAAKKRGGFHLEYHPDADRWQFGLPSKGQGAAVRWHTVASQQPPELGRWTHLAGVYDAAAGKVRLYVDGVPQGEADGPRTPWMADGPTLIGCTGTTKGRRSAPLGGAVDDVRLWSFTVHPDRLRDLAAA